MNDSDLIGAITLIIQNADKITRNNIVSFILSTQPHEQLQRISDYVTGIV